MPTFSRSRTILLHTGLLLLGGCLRAVLPARADTSVIHINAAQVTNHVTPSMTGSCLEDVNHEVYGGLYDQKIFGESFEEPPAAAKFLGWTSYGGDWEREADGCTVDTQSGAKLVRDAPPFADGTVDVDVKMPLAGTGNAGLLVRVRNPGVGADAFDGYEISLSADGKQVILGKHQRNFQPLATAPANAAPGAWNHLRVVLTGPRIQIFVDGATTPAIDFTDPHDPLPAGRIALRNWLTAASFRAVQVQTGTAAAAKDIPLQAAPSYAVSGMWDAIVTGTAQAVYQRDSTDPFNGSFCQKITHGTGAGEVGVANRGLNRWGIAVKRGQKFAGQIYLRAQDLRGPVTLALQSADGTVTYAHTTLPRIAQSWQKYPFVLTSNTADPKARFAVWLDRPGTLWADQAVLMGTGDEQYHGLPVRADIANALVAEGITFLRYGGSAVNSPNYRWKDMIGNPDKRPPYNGTWYPDETNGFGIFDFLNFCEAAHIQAAFAINADETDQDAADLADYLTAPVTNPWGRRRAANGHPAPYHVAYLELGNEEVYNPNDHAGYVHYIARVKALADAIHSRNPHLRLVCAANWLPQSPDMHAVFNAVDGRCAVWDLHVWSDAANAGQEIDRTLTQMQALFHQWDPKTTLKAVIFEENGGLHDMQRALGHASTLNATERHGDFVLADCPANCLQPWHENDNGWDQGQLFFTAGHVWAMPPYYAQQMISRSYEPLRVESAVTGSDALEVLATRSPDAKTLVLSVVNTSAAPVTATMTLTGFAHPKSPARAWTLAGDLNMVNGPTEPPLVHPVQFTMPISGTAFTETFPAYSFVTVKITR